MLIGEVKLYQPSFQEVENLKMKLLKTGEVLLKFKLHQWYFKIHAVLLIYYMRDIFGKSKISYFYS